MPWLDVYLTGETPWAPDNPKTSCSSKLEMSLETRGRGVCVGSVVVGLGLGRKEVKDGGGGLEGGGGREGGLEEGGDGGGGGVCRGGREMKGVDEVAASEVSCSVVSKEVRLGGMKEGREDGWSRSLSANRLTLEVVSSSSGSSASGGCVPMGGRLGLSPGRRKGRNGRLVDFSSLPGRRGGRIGGRRGRVRLGVVMENSVVVVVVVGAGVVVVVVVDTSVFSLASSDLRVGSLSPS